MKKATYILLGILILVYLFLFISKNKSEPVTPEHRWKVTSVDTVKYSRDLAREKATSTSFEVEIDEQTKAIADTGATHVSIGTPYDDEFVPFMKKWVISARKNNLKVWFRGNFSGWEGWFDYERITREDHKVKLAEFIKNNGILFEDGDIFTSCPECENGGAGDPRSNGDLEGHRNFLIEEYQIMRDSFRLVGKNVTSNYFPMNGDVARLVMNKDTTKALGGVVTVDHYVESFEKLNSDLSEMAESSGGKVVLGEFGAPVPDIHGRMTEDEQAEWVELAFEKLVSNPNIIGISYWTNIGGSTGIWSSDGTPKKAVEVLTKYFKLTNI